MLFFKKKKLIEISNKLDYVLEQLETHKNMMDQLSEGISELSTKMLEMEKQERAVKEEIKQQIINDIAANRIKLDAIDESMDQQADIVNSALKMLLLNSVLNQLDEE